MATDDYIKAAKKFEQVIRSDVLVGPALAIRVATIATNIDRERYLSQDEITGITTGACAMYRALTGRPQ